MPPDYVLIEQCFQGDAVIHPLRCLDATERPYSLLLYQHCGVVEARTDFIGNADQELAGKKFSRFLQVAHRERTDLAVCPEYSCPWDTLENALASGTLPNTGSIWILGCEAVTPAQLYTIRDRNPEVYWIYEELIPTNERHFLDPVCYIFWTKINGNPRLTVAVQFKCQCMSEHQHELERDHLITGTRRYIFRNDNNSVQLSVMICSDVLGLNLEELPQARVLPYLFVHPQMNLNPRHSGFVPYRQRQYQEHGREHHEFICLNWARGFTIPALRKTSELGGSGIYTSSRQLNLGDPRLDANHEKGLYYTRMPNHHAHAYFLNYNEHLFSLELTQPSQAAAQAMARRRTGPKMLDLLVWNSSADEWLQCATGDDGFATFCTTSSGESRAAVLQTHMVSCGTSMAKERLIALATCEVKTEAGQKWGCPTRLPSFQVASDEVVRRLTFAQDQHTIAVDYRERIIARLFALLNGILTNDASFPTPIADLAGDWVLVWPAGGCSDANICAQNGSRPAVVAYLGPSLPTQIERVFSGLIAMVTEEIRRRLVVWFECDGRLQVRHLPPGRIEDDLSEDPRSIMRSE
jgi:hypothetical protein